MTISWGTAQILAGEAQFSQMMRTLSGNFRESGFDASNAGIFTQAGTYTPVPQTPPSLRPPNTGLETFIVNVELGNSVFVVEAHDQQRQGAVKCLVQMELANTKIQHRLHEGSVLSSMIVTVLVRIINLPSQVERSRSW